MTKPVFLIDCLCQRSQHGWKYERVMFVSPILDIERLRPGAFGGCNHEVIIS